MIECKELNKEFATKEELFNSLRENANELINIKRKTIKHADSVIVAYAEQSNIATKSDNSNSDELHVKLVINTTNVIDSHKDVHVSGIWNKTVKENKSVILLQEHQMKFDKVISDDVKASVKSYSFKDLGFNLDGETEALVFDATISKSRNPFMFEQYKNGYVKEHSIGMQYQKILLAYDSDRLEDSQYKENYDAYLPYIANKGEMDIDYFWIVKEAKMLEGSAVVKGSNSFTPTLEIKSEPLNDTPIKEEPIIEITQTRKKSILI
jgi:hypothetical protein